MLEHVCVCMCLCVRVLTHHNLDAVCMRKCAGVCVSKSRAHVSSSCCNILMCEATTAAVVVLLRTHLLHTQSQTRTRTHTPPACTHINHTF